MNIQSVLNLLVFIIIGCFTLIYVGVLLSTPKKYSVDVLLRYVAAAFFLIVFLGSIICWLLDCSFSFGIPTFGLEDRPHVVG